MTDLQKFCTECGGDLIPGTRFCGHCGHPVGGPVAPGATPSPGRQTISPPLPQPGGPEQILSIVPFIEQGIISIIRFTLIITNRRLIFCTWNQDTDEAMSEAEDNVMDESCNANETRDEIAYFRAKDWSEGAWQRYRSIPLDEIARNAPGSITIPVHGITDVNIVCETSDSTQDEIYIEEGSRSHTFDLMYSQGPFIYQILKSILGERARIEDHLQRRGKIDRLLTGQEYK
jgi:hypothetical protein